MCSSHTHAATRSSSAGCRPRSTTTARKFGSTRTGSRRRSVPRGDQACDRPLKGVYIRYIRRARVRYGAGYYLIPAADADALHPIPERCYAQLQAAVDDELAHVPTNLRPGTRKLEPRFVNQLRSQTTPTEGVCPAALNDTGNGDGCGGGYTVADIEEGHTRSRAADRPEWPSSAASFPTASKRSCCDNPTQSFTVAVINNR